MSLTTIRHLVKAEIKQYKWTILLLTALLIGLVLLSISATYSFTSEQLLDDTPIFVTTIFLLNVVIILVRPKTFRSQNISYNFRACEHLLHLQQLPLKKSTIIFYRMITNYVILIPSLLLYSITIYIVIQPLQELLPFGNFLVFIILLLAVSIIMLDVQVIVDFGTNILFSYIYLIFIFLPVTITIIALYHLTFDKSLFAIIVNLCNNNPVITFLTSVILSGLSIFISHRWLLRRLRNMDYLL